jgi:hypothetical protein
MSASGDLGFGTIPYRLLQGNAPLETKADSPHVPQILEGIASTREEARFIPVAKQPDAPVRKDRLRRRFCPILSSSRLLNTPSVASCSNSNTDESATYRFRSPV